MKTFSAPCLSICLLLLFLIGCRRIDQQTVQDRPNEDSRPGYSVSLDEQQCIWVERTLSELTVRELAGQIVVAWIPGNYVSTESDEFDSAVALVDRGIGGIWMMGGLPHARAAKLNALQSHAKIPMLVTGAGPGYQLFGAPRDKWMLGGGTDVPSPMAYGAIGDVTAVREMGRIVGKEVRATGANFCDDGGGANVLTNLYNVLHNRTYGDGAEQAGRLCAAYVEGVHEAGVLSYVGFFPGAGDLGVDPHVELPVDRNSRDVFQNRNFVPFRHAIRAGVDIVMTSHFAVPGITGSESLPATLSPKVIQILRDDLGFDGPIITDDLSMGAISNTVSSKAEAIDTAVKAFKAGHDLLLGVFAIETADKLAELVESGDIELSRLQASVRRILKVKAKLRLYDRPAASLEAIDEVVGNRQHQRTADRDAERSIVLLRDRARLVPLERPSELRLLSVTLERQDNEEAGAVFDKILRKHVKSVRTIRVTLDSDASIYKSIHEKASDVDLVVFSVYLRPQLYAEKHVRIPDAFAESVQRLNQENRDVIVVSFGTLHVLEQMSDLKTVMLAWSEQMVMQRAAARALLGMSPITGKIPVALSPHHQTGDGLSTKIVNREKERQ